MKISEDVLKQINEFAPDTPPEFGGILGSRRNGVITEVIFDNNQTNHNKICYYAPNVDYLNQCIKEWNMSGISFKGLFHFHFGGAKTLSEAEKKYILKIMQCMPQEVEQLYFPIFVMPNRELICYKARKNRIYSDTIYII